MSIFADIIELLTRGRNVRMSLEIIKFDEPRDIINVTFAHSLLKYVVVNLLDGGDLYDASSHDSIDAYVRIQYTLNESRLQMEKAEGAVFITMRGDDDTKKFIKLNYSLLAEITHAVETWNRTVMIKTFEAIFKISRAEISIAKKHCVIVEPEDLLQALRCGSLLIEGPVSEVTSATELKFPLFAAYVAEPYFYHAIYAASSY